MSGHAGGDRSLMALSILTGNRTGTHARCRDPGRRCPHGPPRRGAARRGAVVTLSRGPTTWFRTGTHAPSRTALHFRSCYIYISTRKALFRSVSAGTFAVPDCVAVSSVIFATLTASRIQQRGDVRLPTTFVETKLTTFTTVDVPWRSF